MQRYGSGMESGVPVYRERRVQESERCKTRLERWVDDQTGKVYSVKQFCLILSTIGSHCTRTDMMTLELWKHQSFCSREKKRRIRGWI